MINPTRVIIEACLVIAVGSICWILGASDERDACHAAAAKKKDQVQEQVDVRDTAAASVNFGMQSYLWGSLPPIDLRAHDARERVRTIYRDHPVPAGCVRPVGVQRELDEARQRAIAAGGPVRAGAHGRDTADPRPR
ncbi:hypothetical protein ACQQ2N_12205 [Dokdonella sp. MW10]|uniref:hypothetical protein n=1 Tax=Dokdonella sp. MW10 TaxID=2992926 RepID=UPI003F7E44D9